MLDISVIQQKFTNHKIRITLKDGTVKHLFMLDVDFASDTDDNEDKIIYHIGKDILAYDGTLRQSGARLPIKDIKTIEYDD